MEPLHGFFLVHKPVGPSSAAVVGRLKWLLKQAGAPKNIKIGHGGTLDPLADGLLPIGVGRGTKQLQALLEGPKTYTFTLAFGTATTTLDAAGEPTATSPVRPSAAQLTALLPQFTGPLLQTPPAFSALKVSGQRAYALARAGQTVTLAPRPVTINQLTLTACSPTAASFSATVSKGTYIRSLAVSLAEAAGTVGHVTQLTRTGHGPFQLSQAIPYATLDKALQTGHITPHLLPLPAPADQQSA